MTIDLPDYAIRYLAMMCHHERKRLSKIRIAQYGLQDEAAYDSLNQIESVIPTELWDDGLASRAKK